MALPHYGHVNHWMDDVVKRQTEEEGSYEIVSTTVTSAPPPRPQAPELLLKPQTAQQLASRCEPLLPQIAQAGLRFDREKLLAQQSAVFAEIDRLDGQLRALNCPTSEPALTRFLYGMEQPRDGGPWRYGRARIAPADGGPECEAWRFSPGISRECSWLMRRWKCKIQARLAELLLERLDSEGRAVSPLFAAGLKGKIDPRLLVLEADLLGCVIPAPGARLLRVRLPDLDLRATIGASGDQYLSPLFSEPGGWARAYSEMLAPKRALAPSLVGESTAGYMKALLRGGLLAEERAKGLNEWHFMADNPAVYDDFDAWLASHCRGTTPGAASAQERYDPWHEYRPKAGGLWAWINQIKRASSDFFYSGSSLEAIENGPQFARARVELCTRNALVLRGALFLSIADLLGQDDELCFVGGDTVLLSAGVKSANRLAENLAAKIPVTLASLFPSLASLNLINLEIV